MATFAPPPRRAPRVVAQAVNVSPAIGAQPTSAPHPQATPSITSHCDLALARLLEQFCDSTQLRDLICIFADRAQDIEQELANILGFRSIDTAVGAQLDRLGILFSEFRNGLDDDDYRAVLLSKVQVITSKGTGDEILAVLVAIDAGLSPSTILINEHFPAGFVAVMTVPAGNYVRGFRAARFVREAKGAGIGWQLHFEQQGVIHFGWDADTTAGTWAELSSPATGGVWVEGPGSL